MHDYYHDAEDAIKNSGEGVDVSVYHAAQVCGRIAQMGAFATIEGEWYKEWYTLEDRTGHVYCLYGVDALPADVSEAVSAYHREKHPVGN